MRRNLFLILFSIFSLCLFAQVRQRNIIYVLDCTASMNGYNDSPDIWAHTKNFLKNEIEKEIKSNPDSKITILPFQQNVKTPISVKPGNYSWREIENSLNGYVKEITATNICESWLEAEKFIDLGRDNYIVLMTDGHDNIGGNSNTPNRMKRLAEIFRAFCDKYNNTNGFYVELTEAADLPDIVKEAIDYCHQMSLIPYGDVIPNFGGVSENTIIVNTRDLPEELVLGFSNSGHFKAELDVEDNPFVDITLKDNVIDKGKLSISIAAVAEFKNNIASLNKAMGESYRNIDIALESEEVNITNPKLTVRLVAAPIRSLDIDTMLKATLSRVHPFLWIKGNEQDTLRWNLNPRFSEQAHADFSNAKFGVTSIGLPENSRLFFDGEELADSIFTITPASKGNLELIVPSQTPDGKVMITLHQNNSTNLDRINNQRPGNLDLQAEGEYDTSASVLEIICWCLLGLILLFIILWFCVLKNQKYPKFKQGIITVKDPYYGVIRAKGYRKLVMGPSPKKQGMFDKIIKGEVLYHTNPAWPTEVEITPSGRKNMKFRSKNGKLISSPTMIWSQDNNYDILDEDNKNKKIITIQISR